MIKYSAENAKKSETLKKSAMSVEKFKILYKIKPTHLKMEWHFARNVNSGFIKNVTQPSLIMKKNLIIFLQKIKSIIVLLADEISKSKNLKILLKFLDSKKKKKIYKFE
jgi:hypothetical protein